MGQKNYKEESRKNWVANMPEGAQLSNEDLKFGAILRIADATELMAKNFLELQRQNEYLKNRNTSLSKNLQTEKRRSAKYKGLYLTEKKSNINNQNL